MRLIVDFLLICFAIEAAHCSRSSWNYLKRFSAASPSDSAPADSYLEPVMPLQVRICVPNIGTFFALYLLRRLPTGPRLRPPRWAQSA